MATVLVQRDPAEKESLKSQTSSGADIPPLGAPREGARLMMFPRISSFDKEAIATQVCTYMQV